MKNTLVFECFGCKRQVAWARVKGVGVVAFVAMALFGQVAQAAVESQKYDGSKCTFSCTKPIASCPDGYSHDGGSGCWGGSEANGRACGDKADSTCGVGFVASVSYHRFSIKNTSK